MTNDKQLNAERIWQAQAELKNDQIIILPTDTIYGLSARVHGDNEERINELKNADIWKPLIILVSNLDMAKNMVEGSEDDFKKLESAEPTTVIFKEKNGPDTLAIRLVKRDDLIKIIDQIGPIYSTSVNTHGEEPITDVDKLENWNRKVELFSVGELPIRKPSKIYNSIKKEYIR
ncbi:L-threonylcarbamoyladenylate synthase [Mesoplasma lactucae]|uniref:L-threonylcarbamoyladenylate synthase n=1 Tax=Mesoplasma lactucae ATCC 49193 TaxID=81460 RepID=A0A291IS54_9MOLU|nr:Sua5/YciO/YrdC/YwlC family protein [Mesoplasma lactucae]ATG97765.1 translation factor [Mesoplasma lactucae ATCC 49193]ATZ20458.1 tRNA threonylcarbamoyladenosine biosynthesis protein [Mesoplasma lactucae ATCC 49193]MCL8216630.1 Threonylcarbamoyl-AMP synthase [Mesoplasma lactucae ATCC 49193]